MTVDKTLPKWAYLQLQCLKGSVCDTEIIEIKKVTGIKSNTEIMRMALHAYWLDKVGGNWKEVRGE